MTRLAALALGAVNTALAGWQIDPLLQALGGVTAFACYLYAVAPLCAWARSLVAPR